MSSQATNKETKKEEAIYCPFLKAYKPDTSSLWQFASDLSEGAKIGRLESLSIGFDVAARQQGTWKALCGAAPDLYRLHEVPGISHGDLFQKYPSKLDAAAKDGMLTLDDLVAIKKEIAVEEKCSEIIKSSKLETGLIFLGAGGDLDTGRVPLSNVKKFLNGNPIESQDDITFSTVKQAADKCSW